MEGKDKPDLQALAQNARDIAAKIIPPTMPLARHQEAVPPPQRKKSKSVTKVSRAKGGARKSLKKERNKLAKLVLDKYRGKVVDVVPAGLAQQVSTGKKSEP